jgi:hypothetical protein
LVGKQPALVAQRVALVGDRLILLGDGSLKSRDRRAGGSFYPAGTVFAGWWWRHAIIPEKLFAPLKKYFQEFFLARFRPGAAGGGNRGRKPPDRYPGKSQ